MIEISTYTSTIYSEKFRIYSSVYYGITSHTTKPHIVIQIQNSVSVHKLNSLLCKAPPKTSTITQSSGCGDSLHHIAIHASCSDSTLL